MGTHYVLNDDHSVREAGLMEWARFFEDMSKRRVARDTIGDVAISTVFLGLDHSFGEGPPLIFETLISGGEYDQDMWRYSTWDEAGAGHREAVRLATLAAQGMSARQGENSRSEVEGEARQPGPKDAPKT